MVSALRLGTGHVKRPHSITAITGSTIKTLPATLPEPGFKVRVSIAGVTGAVSASDLHVCARWGRRARAVVRRSRTLVDGLIEAGVGSFIGVART